MKLKCVLVCLLMLAAMGIAFLFNGYRQASARAFQIVQSDIDNDKSTVGPIRNLRFTLFDLGIRPREMRCKAGLVNLHFEDRTNASQGVTVQRIVGNERMVIGAVQRTANGNQSRGRTAFRLLPGEYELYDANRPANRALLIVEPQGF